MTSVPATSRGRSVLVAVALLACVLVGVVCRVMNFPAVLPEDQRVVFYGHDSYYHMARTRHALEDFPVVPEFDPYLHFPEGGAPIWPPWFDLLSACLLKVSAADTLSVQETRAAFLPPLYGVLAILLLYPVARCLLESRGMALAACAALSVSGGSLFMTQIGALDHHAIMGLLVAGFLGVGAWTGRRLLNNQPVVGPAACWGAVTAVSILLWPGCLVFLAIQQCWIVSWMLIRGKDPGSLRELLKGPGLVAHLTAAVVLAVGCHDSYWAQNGQWTLSTLSWLHPTVAATLALIHGIAMRIADKFSSPWGPLGWTLGAFVLGSTLAGVAVPELRESVSESLQWVTKDEQFQASVRESRPLFLAGESLTRGLAAETLGWTFPVLPLALLGWMVRGFSTRRDPQSVLLLWTVLALGGLTVIQARFVDLFSVPAALGSAWVLGLLCQPFWNAAKRWKPAAAIPWLLAGLFLWCSRPCLVYFEGQYQRWRELRDETTPPPQFPVSVLSHWELSRTADWMRTHTPPAGDPSDLNAQPDYGVLAYWDIGHMIQYVAERPVVVNNFGDDLGGQHYQDSMRLHEVESEQEAVEILRKYRARYLVTKPPPSQTEQIAWRTVIQLHYYDGKFSENSATGQQLPALQRFRLLHESRPIEVGEAAAGLPQNAALYKVWELVEGATLKGRVAPRAAVLAKVRLKTGRGRTFQYQARSVADESGDYELVLPYSTEVRPETVSAMGPVQVRSQGKVAELSVSEADVLEGNVIQVPELSKR